MDSEKNNSSGSDDTRERLLASALGHFAARGFHGTSIAQIAGHLGLTKQALLYYFKRKHDLYGEVMRLIAERLIAALDSVAATDRPPDEQFEALVLALYRNALENPDDVRVLMHELLENERRDAPPEEWFLKRFLDRFVQMIDEIEELSTLPFPQKFALIFQIISAVKFFAASGQTLQRFYGEDGYAQIATAYPVELQTQVRCMIVNLTGN